MQCIPPRQGCGNYRGLGVHACRGLHIGPIQAQVSSRALRDSPEHFYVQTTALMGCSPGVSVQGLDEAGPGTQSRAEDT